MDLQDYCENMGSEVTAWKARVYDALRKIDEVPSADRGKVEIDGKLARLKNFWKEMGKYHRYHPHL